MRYYFIIVIILSTGILNAQFNIHSGSLNIHDGSVTVTDLSIVNDSHFKSTSESNLIMRSNDLIFLEGDSSIITGNLFTHGIIVQETDVHVHGDLTIYDEYDITDFNLFLDKSLIGEDENKFVTSTGTGEIIKEVTLNPGRWDEPGNLGLQIILNAPSTFTLHRGHAMQNNSYDESIRRYYRFSEDLPQIQELYFYYLEHELNNLVEDNLAVWTSINSTWKEQKAKNFDPQFNFITVTNEESFDAISMFPVRFAGEVYIPTGFSPSGDNINETFIIEGIEYFPNNRLVVFNQFGEIVFEAQPYDNSWQGENVRNDVIARSDKVKSGTYFYIFYKNQNDIEPIKGYVEIRSGE